VKVALLVAVIIGGLLLSVSSVYLNKIVFADDQWSDVAKRQQEQQTRAAMIYGNKYQFDNLNQATRNWSGLSSVTTDENSKGRDIAGKSQMSLENAMSTFDKIHVKQLVELQNTGYAGLTSVTTDEQARDRNGMISQARDQTDKQVADLVSQLAQIDQSYSAMAQVATTDEKGYDRQAQIAKISDVQEVQAASLLNKIWQIDQTYVNLQSGGTTNENTPGRQLAPAQAYALNKAIQIFEEIHAQKLAATYAPGYPGLSSVTTNEQITGQGWWTYGDRHSEIDTGTQNALQNAISFYNAYYPSNHLNEVKYSH
jgi:hypothetical protein